MNLHRISPVVCALLLLAGPAAAQDEIPACNPPPNLWASVTALVPPDGCHAAGDFGTNQICSPGTGVIAVQCVGTLLPFCDDPAALPDEDCLSDVVAGPVPTPTPLPGPTPTPTIPLGGDVVPLCDSAIPPPYGDGCNIGGFLCFFAGGGDFGDFDCTDILLPYCDDLDRNPAYDCAAREIITGPPAWTSSERILQLRGALYPEVSEILTEQAIDGVLTAHQLPEADRDLVMDYARGSVRAHLFGWLTELFATPEEERTDDENAFVLGYARDLRDLRVRQARFSEAQLQDFLFYGECEYTAPDGFEFEVPSGCASGLAGLWNPTPQHPSLDDFRNYGIAHTDREIVEDPEAFAVQVGLSQAVGFGVATVAALGVAAGVYALLVLTSVGAALVKAVAPFLFAKVFVASAGLFGLIAGVGTVAALALAWAGSAFIVALTIYGIIVGGITEVNYQQFLEDASTFVQDASVIPNLGEEIETDQGPSDIFHVFVQSTLPEFSPSLPVPDPAPSDPKFRVMDESGTDLGIYDTIFPQHPPSGLANVEVVQEIGRRGGWFAPVTTMTSDSDPSNPETIETLSLVFDFVDWEGNPKRAWAVGTGFASVSEPLIVPPANEGDDPEVTIDDTTVVEELRYLDVDGERRIARILADHTPPDASISPSPTATIVEGSTLQLTSSASDDGFGLSGVNSWGISPQGPAADLIGGIFQASFEGYDDGVFTVSYRVGDNAGNETTVQTIVTVSNAAPSVTPLSVHPAGPIVVGTPVEVGAFWSDAGFFDTHTASLAWGDGSVHNPTTLAVLDASHTYPSPGIFTVELVVDDDDGGEGRVSAEIVVVEPADLASAIGDQAAGLPTSTRSQNSVESTVDGVVAALGSGKVDLARTRLAKLISRLVSRSGWSTTNPDALPAVEADALILQAAALLAGLNGQVCPLAIPILSEISSQVDGLSTSDRTRSRVQKSLVAAGRAGSARRARAALARAIRTLVKRSNASQGGTDSVGQEDANALVCGIAGAITGF